MSVALPSLGCKSHSPEPMKKKSMTSSMPSSRDSQTVLTNLATLGGEPIETLSPDEARKQPGVGDAAKVVLQKEGKTTDPEPVKKVDDRTIPGPAGALPVRVYTPAGDGPFPIIVYFHGGGWVIATIDTYDSSARALANAAKAVVISVEYRKAPEAKFPAAADDAYAATQWAFANAGEVNGDASRIAVVGESAGGNLATVACLMAKDKGGQMPIYQVLVYPVTELDFNTESHRTHAMAKPLNAAMMVWFRGHYANSIAEDAMNPYAAPMKAKSLAGLPPATIITAETDPLRDDGRLYADKLKGAGVKVRYRNFDAQMHEFFGLGAVVPDAKAAVEFAAEGLRGAFAK